MRDVRRILQEELANLKFPKLKDIEFPVQKNDLRIDTLIFTVRNMQELISNIPTDIVSLSPLVTRLNEIAQAIKTKEVTPITDLKPILSLMTNLEQNLEQNGELNQKEVKMLLSEMTKVFEKTINGTLEKMAKSMVLSLPVKLVDAEKKEDVKKPIPFDITKLAS